MTGRWSDEQTAKFVNLYKNNENLWNVSSPDYNNRRARAASLDKMAREMKIPNFDVKDVPRKIKSLRSTYLLEVKKIEKSKCSGTEVHKPTIKWFSIMDFVMKNINSKEKETCSDSAQQTWQSFVDEEDLSSTDNPTSPPPSPSPPLTQCFQGSRRRTAHTPDLQDTICQMKQSLDTLNNVLSRKQRDAEDECDLYGRLLAKRIRKLSENEREEIMYEIDTLFMGRYSRRASSASEISVPMSSHPEEEGTFAPLVLYNKEDLKL